MKVSNLTKTAVFGAMAAAMQAAENMFVPVALPGGRLGLANIVIMICLEKSGIKTALAVTIIKSVLSVLVTGSVTSFIYSVSGSIIAVIAMHFSKRIKGITCIGAGVIGAFANNAVQTAVGAAVISSRYMLTYIWMLGPVSVVCGAFTGFVAGIFISRRRQSPG